MRTIEDLDKGTIRRIDWQELVPGILIFRAFSQSFTLGSLFTGTFLILAELVMIGAVPPADTDLIFYFKTIACPFINGPNIIFSTLFFGIVSFFILFQIRRKTVRMISSERVTWCEAFSFTYFKYAHLMQGIVIPGGAFLILAVIARLLTKSALVFNIASPVILFLSFLNVFIAAALLPAFPMIAAAIAVDGCDGFDAFSRAYSYISQRPFHTIFYLTVTVLFGIGGFFLLEKFTGLAICFAKTAAIGFNPEYRASDSIWSLIWWSGAYLLPYGFLASYYATAGSALYLILRKNVDGIAFDQITLRSDEKPRKLRPILKDAEGAPAVSEAGAQTPEPEVAEAPNSGAADK